MPTVIDLSRRETADLYKVTALEVHTGSVVVQSPDAEPQTLSPGDSLIDPRGPLEVRGPGRIKYWVEGEPYEAPTAPRGDAGGSSGGAYEARTEEELYELAKERKISGRSKMNKEQLIAALREKA